MLRSRKVIILTALVFILIGCNSDHKSVDDVTDSGTNTDTPIDEGSTSPDNNDTPAEERLSKPRIAETIPSNWYVRLIAEDASRGLKSSSTQLGELEEDDAVEKHTLTALNPLNGSYLDIVFVNPDGAVPGEYKSNFHVYTEGIEDQWSFTVKTDDNRSDIMLTWQGVYVLTPYTDEQSRKRYKEYRSVTNPLIKNIKLVDTANGKEIPLMEDDKIETYTFNMNGQNERTFKWIMQIEEVLISPKTSKVSTMENQLLKSEIRAQSVRKKSDTFDLTKPPMIK